MGVPQKRWMVYFMENPIYKWMKTGGYPHGKLLKKIRAVRRQVNDFLESSAWPVRSMDMVALLEKEDFAKAAVFKGDDGPGAGAFLSFRCYNHAEVPVD